MARRGLSYAAILVVFLACAGGAAAAKRRQQRQRRDIEPMSGPTDEKIWDSGLIEKKLSYATVVEKGRQYYEDTSSKRFKGFVLGYVTPWNRAGYTNAVLFRRKLDAVAPVWFQIKKEKDVEKPVITGNHEVNQTWISELRQDGGGPLVLPRFIVEAEPEQHVELLQNARPLMEAVATAVVGHGLDGMVLEVWSAWHSMNGLQNDMFREAAMQFVRVLGEVMHGNGGKKLFLAVPPMYPSSEKGTWISREDLLELSKYVDGFSVMTYDHNTGRGSSGPNSPLPWLKTNLMLLENGPLGTGPNEMTPPLPDALKRSFLLGTNWYGWDFSPSRGGLAAVTQADLLALLARHQPSLQWHDDHEEHSFEYTDKEGAVHSVWYPTPRSLELRLEAAQEAGVGLSIWELGQGLERFFELL